MLHLEEAIIAFTPQKFSPDYFSLYHAKNNIAD
jgi:hypothetical protein